MRAQERRAAETEEKKNRLARMKEATAERRRDETVEEHQQRCTQIRKRYWQQAETEEKRDRRLARQKAARIKRIARETPGEKEARLAADKEKKRVARRNI